MSKLEDRIKGREEANTLNIIAAPGAESLVAALHELHAMRNNSALSTGGVGRPEGWPEHNPNDLPVDYPDRNHYE